MEDSQSTESWSCDLFPWEAPPHASAPISIEISTRWCKTAERTELCKDSTQIRKHSVALQPPAVSRRTSEDGGCNSRVHPIVLAPLQGMLWFSKAVQASDVVTECLSCLAAMAQRQRSRCRQCQRSPTGSPMARA
jgi:hypothetical protein